MVTDITFIWSCNIMDWYFIWLLTSFEGILIGDLSDIQGHYLSFGLLQRTDQERVFLNPCDWCHSKSPYHCWCKLQSVVLYSGPCLLTTADTNSWAEWDMCSWEIALRSTTLFISCHRSMIFGSWFPFNSSYDNVFSVPPCGIYTVPGSMSVH